MRTSARRWAVSLAALAIAAGGACSTPPGRASLYRGDGGRELTVAVGGSIEVWLVTESPATSWPVPSSSNPEVLTVANSSSTKDGGMHARLEARREGTAVVTTTLQCRSENGVRPVCRVTPEPWRVTIRVAR